MKVLLDKHSPIGVLGSGTMGAGIAQLAASHGHKVILFDLNHQAVHRALAQLEKSLARLVEKGKLTAIQAEETKRRISAAHDLREITPVKLVIEAIVEDLMVKKELFRDVEAVVSKECILATNTSSLSVTAIAAACRDPSRVLGIHFFNPAPIMSLVETVPGIQTGQDVMITARNLLEGWGKEVVVAKDTPGFIVNRIARPFYGEALRILEEGIADAATIDFVLREVGGFRMGPFELMDLIGNDINFRVTQSVFEAFFYEPRYRPSLVQKRLVEAGFWGRKTERGYYDYREGTKPVEPNRDTTLGKKIFERILAMLINEACEAVYLNVASVEDIDLAVTKGVNYPKGLLHWADEVGLTVVLGWLDALYEEYREDRYRASVLLRRMVNQGERFYS